MTAKKPQQTQEDVMKAPSAAWTDGFEAHAAGKIRTPALDPAVSDLIKVTSNDTKAVLATLTDWLKGWDHRHHAEVLSK